MYKLKENTQIITDFSELIFTLGNRLCDNKINDKNYFIADDISELLLKLYDIYYSQNDITMQKCLDLWDRLLECRIVAAKELTKKIDKNDMP
ncbi:MAG: hypothetical protein QMC67_13055 [Candidatus Wallbacteria bacterium]